MVSKYFRLFALLLSILSAASAAAAVTRAVNGVIIDQAPVLENTSQRHGYEEIAYNLTNTTDKPRQVRLSIEGKTGGYSLSLESLSRQVTVPPNTTLRATLFKPYMELNGPKLIINVHGTIVTASDIGLINPPYKGASYGRYYDGKNCILLSRSVSGNAVKFHKASKSKNDKIFYIYASIPLKSWSDSWLAFSGFDSIMLTPEDWENIPTRSRKALMDYVAVGGSLVFCGGKRPDSSSVLTEELFAKFHGFGVLLYAPANPEKFSSRTWKKVESVWNRTSSTLRAGISSFHDRNPVGDKFEVVKKDKAPAFQLFFLMLVFAVIIGPLNLYILHRKKKRIWILWTTPVIALVFSLLVVGYSFVAEGWSSKVKVAAFTLLDENSQTASTLGVIGYYCPLSPGPLIFDDSVEIQPFTNFSCRGNSYSVDWTNGQKLTGDWIKPRITSVITLRKSEQRRERIKIVSIGKNNIRIVNGLGSKLQNIILRLPDGRSFKSAGEINPGATATLTIFPVKYNLNANWQRENIFCRNWLDSKLGSVDRTAIPHGTYYAKIADSTFLKAGIEPDELKTFCHVLGILAEGGAK